jgi:ribosomal protein S18 acetylase RimI-like enzyme
LLAALVAAAREHGLAALSLSVEPDNRARHLYERFGFQEVGTEGGSLTMLLRL